MVCVCVYNFFIFLIILRLYVKFKLGFEDHVIGPFCSHAGNMHTYTFKETLIAYIFNCEKMTILHLCPSAVYSMCVHTSLSLYARVYMY